MRNPPKHASRRLRAWLISDVSQIMAFPHAQRWQDWVTQAWNIALGRRLNPALEQWICGPLGLPGVIGEIVIEQVAKKEALTIERNSNAGLLDSLAGFGELTLHREVSAFYEETANYEFDVWTKWELPWGYFGQLVDALFARRIAQLSLPMDPMDTRHGIDSEIIVLRTQHGAVKHRVWLRKLRTKGSVIYSGFYDKTVTPSGDRCVKVVFPLPYGSATVVMKPLPLPNGGLRLLSAGKGHGDPGFYFIVQDRLGNLWSHYLKCFHERIDVYLDGEGTLRADHTMRLWNRLVYSLHYRMQKRANKSPETTPTAVTPRAK